MIRTLLIDNYDSFTYNLYHAIWKVSGVRPILIKNDAMSVAAAAALDFENIVISPGPGTATDPEDTGICSALLERFPDTPVLGICLGQQLIGHYFGANIRHAPHPQHGKYATIRLMSSRLFDGLPPSIQAVRYHSLVIDRDRLPSYLRVTAESEAGQLIMAIEHRERPWFGVQFHPESIGTPGGEQLIRNFLELSANWLRYRSLRPPQALRDVEVSELPWIDPEQAFAHCYLPHPYAFWLDSSLEGPNGRYSFMGSSDTFLTLEDGQTRLQKAGETTALVEPDALFELLRQHLQAAATGESPHNLPFKGGWMGYIGYETRAHLPIALPKRRTAFPDALFLWVENFIAFDHRAQKLYACSAATDARERGAWMTHIRTELSRAPALEKLHLSVDATGPCEPNRFALQQQRPRAGYVNDIRDIQSLIADGETYEVCLSNAFWIKTTPDPFDLYRVLRLSNPAPYAAYLQMPQGAALCSSPECFFTLDAQGAIKSEPIKGTRPKGATPEENAVRRAELLESAKDHSELLMIVDLIRNDLAAVCQPGSVAVPELVRVTEYATVLQASSRIEGQLLPHKTPVDALRALFPGGSVTGAPKLRTLQFIDRFENRPRGLYTGSIGYFSTDRAAEFNIAIRTLVYDAKNKILSFGSGGAIVAESIPEEEYREILVKAYPLLRAAHLACFGAFEHYRLHRTDKSGTFQKSIPSATGIAAPDFEQLFKQ